MSDLQEQTLLDLARQGDRDAFGELIRRYQKRVLALTCRLCRSPEDGQEAAQEAFLSAWQALPRFRGEASFSTWLCRLAYNSAMDILRREGRAALHAGPSLDDADAGLDLPDPAPSPQSLAERAELRGQIEDALRQLSPMHREILLLREMEQLSYEEIGRALSLDAGTVKSRISRARRNLREILLKSGNFSAAAPSNRTESRRGEEGRV